VTQPVDQSNFPLGGTEVEVQRFSITKQQQGDYLVIPAEFTVNWLRLS
jgi:hypothetical protein